MLALSGANFPVSVLTGNYRRSSHSASINEASRIFYGTATSQ
jgi:hypothetical protein